MTGHAADPLSEVLSEAFLGQERLSRDDIHRRAVAADLPPDQIARVDRLPEGEYAFDEAAEALNTDADA